MAKGVEDTAFYRYGRLLALNDVGGDPSRFGISVEAFHAGGRERAERFPRNLLVTQTHDTKRSGDVRARIGALAGMAEEWEAHVRTWLVAAARTCRGRTAPSATSSSRRSSAPGRSSPSASRPTWRRRCARPSATRTGSSPTRRTRRRSRRSAAALYEHEAFLADFEPFADEVARAGERAALGQLLLKLTVPGMPDIYNGDELRSLSLVDPDNRRPVDWDARRAALAALADGAEPDRETVKLLVIQRALALRARRPEAFAGAYTPIDGGAGGVRVRARRGRGARRGAGARQLAGRDAQAARRARRAPGATCSPARCASSRAARRSPSSPRRTALALLERV